MSARFCSNGLLSSLGPLLGVFGDTLFLRDPRGVHSASQAEARFSRRTKAVGP